MNRDSSARRPTVIGFLENEDDDPTAFTWLDVGGITRVRDLREDSTKTCLVLGAFADTTAQGDSADHYLTRLDFTGDSTEVLSGEGTWVQMNGADCRWEDIVSITGIGNTDIRTGFDTEDDCYRQNVVIGAAGAKSKLAVEARTERDNSPIGVLFDMTDSDPGFDAADNSGVVTALLASSEGVNGNQGNSYVGIQARANFGRYAVGLDSEANSGIQNSIGVYSRAGGALNSSADANIAYYGEVPNGTGVLLYRVGGQTITTGMTIMLSDESVKQNVEEIHDASYILSQLAPKPTIMFHPITDISDSRKVCNMD
jgi:hypothetical protein